MNGPDLELRLDNLIAELSLELSQIQKDRQMREQINARLERIEQSLALPLVYSPSQAARRLGYGVRWLYDHLSDLPAPVSLHPLRFRVSDIDAFATGRDVAPRNAPRRRRKIA